MDPERKNFEGKEKTTVNHPTKNKATVNMEVNEKVKGTQQDNLLQYRKMDTPC